MRSTQPTVVTRSGAASSATLLLFAPHTREFPPDFEVKTLRYGKRDPRFLLCDASNLVARCTLYDCGRLHQ
jgi:hypothetical protein